MRLHSRTVPLAAAAGTLLASFPGWAQTQSGPYYGPHMWGGGWFFPFLGPVMMLGFFAVAVIVVVLIVRWLGGTVHGGHTPHWPPGRTPLDLLKERFARGEIDASEYEERRRILGE